MPVPGFRPGNERPQMGGAGGYERQDRPPERLIDRPPALDRPA
jgi:hypothetical protein